MKYAKTEAGQQAFKDRSPVLAGRLRTAFILFDGVKSVDQVLAATSALGFTMADVENLLRQGLIAPAAGVVPAAPPVAAGSAAAPPDAAPASSRTPQQRYADAYPLATKLTASLGLRGFKLNLAVEAASGYDDLLALLPRIQGAVGVEACTGLERALRG